MKKELADYLNKETEKLKREQRKEVAINSTREQIQEDLLCLLDHLSIETKSAACEIVVKNFKKMKKELTKAQK